MDDKKYSKEEKILASEMVYNLMKISNYVTDISLNVMDLTDKLGLLDFDYYFSLRKKERQAVDTTNQHQ